ncbi:MAG: ferredoxin-type protein NapF [Gammaproteobacteria bacterium]|nr:ferredoxin-type protein NapF [Gammaproteobacteria bacterium]
MNTAINRSQFLRGDYSGKASPIRPPWSSTENQFLDSCDSCGDCIERCPTNIIQKGRGNYPVINFNAGECLFCGDCAKACETGALTMVEGQQPWAVTAALNTDNCLAFKGVECRSCYDPCEAGSISMTPRLGGVSIPGFDAQSCTGCGACLAICPTQAIRMSHEH